MNPTVGPHAAIGQTVLTSDACGPLALADRVSDLLVLLQRPVAGTGDRRGMNENVRAAAVRGDEAELLFGVEPLDRGTQ